MSVLVTADRNYCKRGSYNICVEKLVNGEWRRLTRRRGSSITHLTYGTRDVAESEHPPGPTCRIIHVTIGGKVTVLSGG